MQNSTLIKQIQYYLSEKNLENDQFFYKEVASNKDHFVNLKCFLNCNKIKKMNITKVEQIIKAVESSDRLELNSDKTMLRLKSLENLPEFRPKKKVKVEQKTGANVNPYDKFQPVIYSLSLESQQTVPFRYIQEALLKTYGVYSPYVRFNKTQGNFAVKKEDYQDQLSQILQKGLKVGETQIIVTLADKDKLSQFWQKHGQHYNGIVDNLRKDFNKKFKQEKRTQSRNKKIEFKFGGEIYQDINKLKSLFKNILCRNPNNTPLKQGEHNLVKELLSYHESGQQKLKNLKHFVVDVHPNYVDTRCLFAVKEDGSREDFSIVKCIQKIEQQYGS